MHWLGILGANSGEVPLSERMDYECYFVCWRANWICGDAPCDGVACVGNASAVATVEFYEGSTKLGESLSPPYKLSWTNVPPGQYSFIVRAIDNLGGATDSTPVAISVSGGRPKLDAAVRLTGNIFQFALTGGAGSVYLIQQSTNLTTWTTLRTVTNTTGAVTFQDPLVAGQTRKFYRAMLSQ